MNTFFIITAVIIYKKISQDNYINKALCGKKNRKNKVYIKQCLNKRNKLQLETIKTKKFYISQNIYKVQQLTAVIIFIYTIY